MSLHLELITAVELSLYSTSASCGETSLLYCPLLLLHSSCITDLSDTNNFHTAEVTPIFGTKASPVQPVVMFLSLSAVLVVIVYLHSHIMIVFSIISKIIPISSRTI